LLQRPAVTTENPNPENGTSKNKNIPREWSREEGLSLLIRCWFEYSLISFIFLGFYKLKN
jgi:hypothetical protein